MHPRIESLQVGAEEVLGFSLPELSPQIGSHLPLATRHAAKARPDTHQSTTALLLAGRYGIGSSIGGPAVSDFRDVHVQVLNRAVDGHEMPKRSEGATGVQKLTKSLFV